jgi:hypothetical protein
MLCATWPSARTFPSIGCRNVVYALFILWFGAGFWERHGSDEAVFFVLAIIVFPALFLLGAIGSIVFLAMEFQNHWRRSEGHSGELG